MELGPWREYLDLEPFSARFEAVERAYETAEVYPPRAELFSAFELTPPEQVRVVILGQDPYHEPGQAHGLAFSVQKGVPVPPSLQNIYKELQTDLGCTIPHHGNLEEWARQGVLLLNTVLTVREGQANSHKNRGWEPITDRIITLLNARETPMVFLLWGANARGKLPLIRGMQHLVLAAPHPSPLSAHSGFFGCRHFSRANEFLVRTGQSPIDWQIHD